MGIVSGVAAAAFLVAIDLVDFFALETIVGYRPPHPPGEPQLGFLGATPTSPFRPWLLLVIPAAGALAGGILVAIFAPEAEGHGTNSVIKSFHREQGKVRPIVPVVKIVASALTIGSGGSGGREGPIAQIGAGFGSFLSDRLGLGPDERRLLLAAGMGAGISAIFRAPLAGAFFAAEVLYRAPEFEGSVLVPAGVASAVAYATFGAIFGFHPLFDVPDLKFNHALELVGYSILAVWLVVVAHAWTGLFLRSERAFRQAPLWRGIKPAVGGVLAGAVALAIWAAMEQDLRSLAVLGAGYGILVTTANDPMSVPAVLLLAIAAGKIATTSLSIGSGGSGGVFGPSVVIGGCAAATLGIGLQAIAAPIAPPPAACLIVGMAGFFAAAAKTPFSSLILVSEVTGDFQLFVPAMWVSLLAYRLSGAQSIYESQLETKPRSLARMESYRPASLVRRTVGDLLDHFAIATPEVSANDPLDVALAKLIDSPYTELPVRDDAGGFVGLVGIDDVYTATRSDLTAAPTLGAIVRPDVTPLHREDTLEDALARFVELDLLTLPVVASDNPRSLLGMIGRADVDRAYLKLIQSHRSSPRPGHGRRSETA